MISAGVGFSCGAGDGSKQRLGWFMLTEETTEKGWSTQWILIYPPLCSFHLAGAWKLYKSLLQSWLLLALLSKLPRDVCISG